MSKNQLLQTLFEEWAQKTPCNIALNYKNQQLTYTELNARANQLAHFLLEQGVQDKEVVGIYCTSSFEQIIILLATLKIGAAYLPIDPKIPTSRINYMLQDAAVKIVLTNLTKDKTNLKHDQLVFMEHVNDALQNFSTQNIQSKLQSSNLAYIIYTSGTTGNPKGVMVEHQNAYNTVSQMQEIFSLLPSDKIFLNVSLSFDPSVWMIFWPLSQGASIILDEMSKDPEEICNLIIKNQLRLFHVGPTLFRMLVTNAAWQACTSLELIIGGGEAWKISDLDALKKKSPNCALCNVYGPTEASIHVTWWCSKNYLIDELITEIPIGKPIKQMNAYIFDENYNELSTGEVGELYIGGQGLARGYLNLAQLTEEKFIVLNGERLYKTGDLAKLEQDGNFYFMGRVDEQIKLRGFRIELLEIENWILKSGLIKNVAVIVAEENGINKQLIACLVYKTNQTVQLEKQLKEYLREHLPEYMIPNQFVPFENLPLSINHKVDKKTLASLVETELKQEQLAIENNQSIENILFGLLKNSLKIDSIHEEDNFFDLGMDSLSGLDLIGKINEELNLRLSVVTLFNHPSIKSLTQFLNLEHPKVYELFNHTDSKHDHWTLSDNQLWLARMAKGSNLINNIVIPYKIETNFSKEIMEKSVNHLIKNHDILQVNIIFENQHSGRMILNQKLQTIFSFVDLSALTQAQQQIELDRQYLKLNHQIINLEKDPLFSITLLQCSDSLSYIFIFMHHLISDPSSAKLVLHELLQEYQRLKYYPTVSSKVNNTSFSNYIAYEKNQKTKDSYKKALKNWVKLFSEETALLKLSEIDNQDLTAGFISTPFPLSLSNEIRNHVKKLQVTLFVFLLSSCKVCLFKLHQQKKFGIGINISKRADAAWVNMIGPLSEQAVSFINFDEVNKFEDVLNFSQNNLTQIYESAITIESIYQELRQINANATELFNVLFDYEREDSQFMHNELNVHLLPVRSSGLVRRHLSIRITDNHQDLTLQIRYRKNLFDEAHIRQLSQEFLKVVEKIINSALTIKLE